MIELPPVPPTLAGLTVCLSGAIPEREAWAEPAMDRSILEFVASFAAAVFDRGGRIVHGSHPAFTPVLLAQAAAHAAAPERPLTLLVPMLWKETLPALRRAGADRHAELVPIALPAGVPADAKPEDALVRRPHLTDLRHQLMERADVVVAVGGLLHKGAPWLPGVTEELHLAADRGVPRLVVASFGGDAGRIVAGGAAGGAEVVATPDVGRSVGQVVAALERIAATRAPATFSFLHFTDLHVGHPREAGRYPNIRDAVLRDLALRAAEGWTWDALFFTGDLAFRGDAAELAVAGHRLRELVEGVRTLQGWAPHLCVVPGNHDLVRPPAARAKGWRDQLADPQARSALFGDAPTALREELGELFAPYVASVRGFPVLPGFQPGLFPGEFATRLLVRGVSVGVVGLNTALLHWGDDARGGLAMDIRQLSAVTGLGSRVGLARNAFNVLLTHHPADWLDPAGRLQLETEVYQHDRFDLHLHGHMHLAGQTALAGPRGSCYRLQGRALFAAEEEGYDRLHGYGMGRLRLVPGSEGWDREMVVRPREAIRVDNGWVFDGDGATAGRSWELRASAGRSRVPASQAPPTPAPRWRSAPGEILVADKGETPTRVPAGGKRVLLSAGLPRSGWSHAEAAAVETAAAEAAIVAVCTALREAGVDIVFGGQPGVLAAILRAMPEKADKPWILCFQHGRFKETRTEEALALAQSPAVQFVWVGTPGTSSRKDDLAAMRAAMLATPGLAGAVFIAGKDGVRAEFEDTAKVPDLAARLVAIGAGGGAAREILLAAPEQARGALTDSGALFGTGPALGKAVVRALGLP